jgi:hypothetical protein
MNLRTMYVCVLWLMRDESDNVFVQTEKLGIPDSSFTVRGSSNPPGIPRESSRFAISTTEAQHSIPRPITCIPSMGEHLTWNPPLSLALTFPPPSLAAILLTSISLSSPPLRLLSAASANRCYGRRGSHHEGSHFRVGQDGHCRLVQVFGIPQRAFALHGWDCQGTSRCRLGRDGCRRLHSGS